MEKTGQLKYVPLGYVIQMQKQQHVVVEQADGPRHDRAWAQGRL
jgi:hypothetical protein